MVLETPAAAPEEAAVHFAAKLSVETDPSDVHADMTKGIESFVVVDTRLRDAYLAGHVPGALSIPHRSIGPGVLDRIPLDKVVVTYCWGPGCNASTKGALRFARLGYRVKEMIGGLEYWLKEGYPTVTGES